MSFAIDAIGTAVPETKIDQTIALEIARQLCSRTPEQETWLPSMYEGTGISSRHLFHSQELVDDIVNGTELSDSPYLPTGEPHDQGPTTGRRMRVYAQEAIPLAVGAARQAMNGSHLSPGDISHLVTVSCTGFTAPGVDFALIDQLSLRPTVERSHIGFMGCHGALNGLRVARAFLEADRQARALVCAVELCSAHYHYGWDPQKIIANALFADGAAAVVGAPVGVAGPGAWKILATGSCLIPGSTRAMGWDIGEHGFEMRLSKKIPDLICQHLRPWLEEWLSNQHCSIAEVASWAVHPGGPKILEAVEDSLSLPPQATACSREILSSFGNMSSPTLLFILHRLMEQDSPRPCVALGFGPGLVAEAILFG